MSQTTATPPQDPSAGLVERLRSGRFTGELTLLAGLLVLPFGFGLVGKSVPAGIYGLGLVSGAGLVLHALGVVLVFRSNRIIDFAQFSFGAAAAGVFSVLVNGQPLLRATRAVCPPCLDEVTPLQAQVNYWLSAVLSLALSVGLAWVVYRLVVRRFENAPRLILTVATIFLAQALPIIAAVASRFGLTDKQRLDQGALAGAVKPPFDVTLTVHQGGLPVLFHGPDLLKLLAGVVAAVAVVMWMRRSRVGNAIRAASESPDRAATLGIDVAGVTSRIWLIVGLLSGVAGMLSVSQGAAPSGFDASTLTQILLVGVLARFTSLGVAALGAVVIGVLQSSALWSFGSSTAFEGALVLLVALALLLQRKDTSRAAVEAAAAWTADREIRPIPPELASMSSVRTARRFVVGAVAAVLIGFPFVMSPGQVQVGALVLAYALVALSLLVLTGWGGQISLGQLSFGAVGAYVAAVVHAPFPVALVVGAVVGAVAAVLVGIPALRLQGLHLAVISLAFAVSTSAVLLDPGALGRFLPDTLPQASLGVRISDGVGSYFVGLVLVVLTVLAVSGLRRTRTGRALIAARDNERAAQAFGISLLRLRLSAFAVSGAISGLA
ncbi:MAG: ABC-type branched-chain amino acid transport system, permease component, partial [Frankiales bacterium]|nr:ABC-type branched-chain amino acid transport system, permease component [Frankiales bacterium]